MNRIRIAAISIILIVTLCSCSSTQSNSLFNPGKSGSAPSGAAGGEPTIQISIDDSEIQRAVNYGFVPEDLLGDWDSTITFSQYCSMLKNMLAIYDTSLVPQWEKTAANALASNDPMQRKHGMVATYYAAALMGLGQTTNGNWTYMDQVVKIDDGSYFDTGFEKWFPDSSQPTQFYDIAYKKRLSGWNYGTSARLWIMGQTSPVSGMPIFDIDFDQKTNRPIDGFTRQEAIRAVLRLYESTFKPTDDLSASDPKSLEILSLADERREAILNSPTEIVKSDTFIQGKTYTGTAYYVALDGNDAKDGKSPETAWATLDKVNSARLAYGDAVFFKRGDTWFGKLWGQSGVTYSAYGTGAKPVISGSVKENAATPDKWSLFYSGENGEKVWVYYRDLGDITGIFFNDGENWANKVYPFWDKTQYVSDTGEPFDVTTGLAKDLDFFSAVDLTKIDPFDRVSEADVSGRLYMRSDAGNPGEIYETIDFSQDGTGISPFGNNGKDMTIDNLHVEYFGMLGISVAGYQGWTNTLVQNNEIGWCGGGITYYSYSLREDIAIAETSGGAIQMSGPTNTAINNYIHHNANKTFVMAIHNRESASFIYSDVFIKGNLLEYNAASLHLANYMEDENPDVPSGFKNVNFEDNLVLYTGFGWVDTKNERTDISHDSMQVSAIECGGAYKNANEGIYITNNVFYLAKYAMVFCYMPEEYQPVFSGNIYAQSENGWLAMWRGRLLSVTENGEEYVRNDLKDATGSVFSIK